MRHEEAFGEVSDFLGDSGFNIFSRVRSSEYDILASPGQSSQSRLPGTKSIVVVGFGGNSFWKVFKSYLRANPEFSRKHADIIDGYTILKLGRASQILDETCGARHAVVYPFGDRGLDFDFVRLGMLGGIGVPSILGILIHPVFGTWISLRAAILTDLEFMHYDAPLSGFDPCPSCPKPCITACPADTVSDRGWDWESCMKWRISTDVCSDKCASRIACPWGKDTRYSDEQIAHHHGFVLRSVKKYFEKSAE